MRSRSIACLLMISVVTWLTYQAFEGYRFLNGLPQLLKHVFNIGFLLAVAGLGSYAFVKLRERWVMYVWLLLYSGVVALLLVFGVVDVLFHLNIQNIRNMLSGLKMFFCSPLPFILMFLLWKMAQSNTPTP